MARYCTGSGGGCQTHRRRGDQTVRSPSGDYHEGDAPGADLATEEAQFAWRNPVVSILPGKQIVLAQGENANYTRIRSNSRGVCWPGGQRLTRTAPPVGRSAGMLLVTAGI